MAEHGFGVEEEQEQAPLVLGPEMLRKSQPAAPGSERLTAPPSAHEAAPRPEQLIPARVTDNECILFDEEHRSSWIVYPPRSAYTFVPRRSPTSIVVEHRRWTPMTPTVFHEINLTEGCADHGLLCPATVAMTAATSVGYDAFR